jgi:hypothetical protein
MLFINQVKRISKGPSTYNSAKRYSTNLTPKYKKFKKKNKKLKINIKLSVLNSMTTNITNSNIKTKFPFIFKK